MVERKLLKLLYHTLRTLIAAELCSLEVFKFKFHFHILPCSMSQPQAGAWSRAHRAGTHTISSRVHRDAKICIFTYSVTVILDMTENIVCSPNSQGC